MREGDALSLPKGWKEVELGEVLNKIVGGGTPSKANESYWNGNIYWCSVKDMTEESKYLYKTEDTISEEGLKNSSANLIKKGTLITATRMGLGRAFIAGVDMAINQDLKALYPNDKIDNIFLLYSILFNKDVIDGLGTGATVKGIKLETLRSIKLNLPPLETQKKIASILSGYDNLIENNLKRIKILEEMAQQTYEEWFVRMRFPGHDASRASASVNAETGLPEGWEEVKLGDLCDLQQGFALNKKSQHYISETKTEYPLLKISDLINNTETLFVKETIPNQFKIDFEDIIYSRTGQVGLSFIGVKGIIYNNCFKVKPFNEDIKYYLLQFLRQPITIDIAKSLATGAAQPDLNHSVFKSIEIKRADLDLCIRYSEYYKQIIRVIQNLQNQNQRLREARDILLPRLMMGVIEV